MSWFKPRVLTLPEVIERIPRVSERESDVEEEVEELVIKHIEYIEGKIKVAKGSLVEVVIEATSMLPEERAYKGSIEKSALQIVDRIYHDKGYKSRFEELGGKKEERGIVCWSYRLTVSFCKTAEKMTNKLFKFIQDKNSTGFLRYHGL